MVVPSTDAGAVARQERHARDLARMRQASDYAIAHMAAHLSGAGQADRLHALLTSSPAWMEAKFERLGSHAPYAADLEIARATYRDPLDAASLSRLLELHAARQVLHARIVLDTDLDIEVLIRIGRTQEALDVVRLRPDPYERLQGLAVIERLLRALERPDPALLDEQRAVLATVRLDWQRGFGAAALTKALDDAGYGEEARALAFSIAHAGGRRQALETLIASATAVDAPAGDLVDALHEAVLQEPDALRRADGLGLVAAWRFRLGDATAGDTVLNACVESIQAIERTDHWTLAVRDLAINLASGGLFEDAIAQVDVLDDVNQRHLALGRIAERAFDAGDPDGAIAIAQRIDRASERGKVVIGLAARHLDRNERDAARTLLTTAEADFDAADADSPHAATWADLAVQWNRVGEQSAADRNFARAWRAAEQLDEHARFVVARAGLDAGRFDEARSALDRLPPKSGRYLLRDLALALARRGDLTAATLAFGEGRRLAAALEDPRDADSVRSAVAAQATRLHRFDIAERVIASIVEPRTRASAWTALAVAQHADGSFAVAMATSDRIVGLDGSDESFATLASVFSAAGDIPRAMTLVGRIAGDAPRAKNASLIARSLWPKDLDQAVQLASDYQDVQGQVNPLGDLATALVDAGLVERGLELIGAMPEGVKRSWALRQAGEALARLGRVDEGLAVVQSIADVNVREFGIRSIAVVLFANGRPDDIARGLAELEASPWDRSRAEAVERAVAAWLRMGHFEAASALGRSLPLSVRDPGGLPLRDRVLATVARAAATAGRSAEARKLVAAIETPERQKAAADAVTDALVARGLETLSAEESAARAARNPHDEDRRDADESQRLTAAGRIDEALTRATRIRDERNRGYAQLDIVRAMANLDRIADARSVAERIDSPPERAQAFAVLAKQHAARGRFDAALEMVADNPGQWERADARSHVCAVLAAQQRLVEALSALGPASTGGLLSTLCRWSEAIEANRPGVLLPALARVCRVAAWSNADWDSLARAIEDAPAPGEETTSKTTPR